MKQVYSNFLLPVLIIVIFLAKNADGGNTGPKPAPEKDYDRMFLTDSTGSSISINEQRSNNYQ